jgi:hypothetical protein
LEALLLLHPESLFLKLMGDGILVDLFNKTDAKSATHLEHTAKDLFAKGVMDEHGGLVREYEIYQ